MKLMVFFLEIVISAFIGLGWYYAIKSGDALLIALQIALTFFVIRIK